MFCTTREYCCLCRNHPVGIAQDPNCACPLQRSGRRVGFHLIFNETGALTLPQCPNSAFTLQRCESLAIARLPTVHQLGGVSRQINTEL